ncbi:aspartyl aminopeptidase [Nitrosomonas cryotolerans]|uniref:M18 family aminopeptidase n=1 Tax=Nitrosomonas cryotolerans ATCC 49181 TaxID=1131553 RepID=A0A1N6GMP4_9PROT|nr:M18 family aminopeptidase [Nitrosomonas cryotolerans]SFP97961.1 aspartyl aminopeptidase [Nitrosomonas cryotolerans]SIO08788.1 aspartyl aminopeptidase [Nitrosomonas cryotolerans ATCC 49181]
MQQFNQELMNFLTAARTPYHAVAEMVRRFESAGFVGLHERDAWSLEPGGRYFISRNGSSIIAWSMPKCRGLEDSGLRMVGAHTDSPCLKVKPAPELYRHGFLQLGVEVYGGALLNPWFDRDLSIAGRINFRCTDGALDQALLDFDRPMAVIPSLAIHLDREVNNGRAINAQTFLPVVLGQAEEALDFRALLKQQLRVQGVDAVEQVLDFDLSLYDTQAPSLLGLASEFVMSARLDNLLSCFIGLDALLAGDTGEGALLVCNDHEEVGSMSAIGAQGPMLTHVLERLLPQPEARQRMLARSMLISADNAHGVHPNFSDRHDSNHGPLLNAGPVIKVNANQRYATSSETSAIFRDLAAREEVPVQVFVVRSDMACGSTVGPITSAEIGVRTLDIGVPQFAMHSVREMAGVQDSWSLSRVLRRFYGQETLGG